MFLFFFFQAEDGIRSLVRSRGLGNVYKRQPNIVRCGRCVRCKVDRDEVVARLARIVRHGDAWPLYTSDAADE